MKTGPVQSTSELYPNPNLTLTISTAKKWGAFNKIKQALSQKGVKLRLLFPARLQVWEWNFYFWDTGGHACILQQASDEQGLRLSMVFPAATQAWGFLPYLIRWGCLMLLLWATLWSYCSADILSWALWKRVSAWSLTMLQERCTWTSCVLLCYFGDLLTSNCTVLMPWIMLLPSFCLDFWRDTC